MPPSGQSLETRQIGDYALLEKLGAGGMGQVYRARHQSTGQIVAIKVLSAASTRDQSMLKRYAREIVIAQQLDHPHIARVQAGSTGETPAWYAMEYVAGANLQQHIQQHGPLTLETAASYVLQVARALAYMHEQGVIHRDIKPANLILTPAGQIKVVDLGLARSETSGGGNPAELATQLTATGMTMGTVDYIAPEQLSDARSVDGRADLYSLGCVLYYLVQGRPPFRRETEVETLLAHTEAKIPALTNQRDSTARHLNRIFRQLLAKNVAERTPSAEALVAELEKVSTLPAPTSQLRRAAHLVGLVVTPLVLVGLAVLALAFSQGKKPVAADPPPVPETLAAAEQIDVPPVLPAVSPETIPRIIRVGPADGVVSTLAEAFTSASGGDTIEIHTNEPQFLEPGSIRWRSGALTLRAGEGYQPIICRQNGVPGPLLTFNSPVSTDPIVLEGLAIINMSAERPEHHHAIVAHNEFEMQRCLLLTYSGGLFANHGDGLDVRIADSYLGVYWPEDGFWPTVSLRKGQLTLENNLLVGNASVHLSYIDTSAELMAERNSLFHSSWLGLDGFVKVTSRGNLFAHCQRLVGTSSESAKSVYGVLAWLEYSGERNLFFHSARKIWTWRGEPRVYREVDLGGLANWNAVLGYREQNPSEADPRFAHPELVQAARSRLVPPEAFAVQADSPLSMSKIGADLSRLAPLPPGLDKVVPKEILHVDSEP